MGLTDQQLILFQVVEVVHTVSPVSGSSKEDEEPSPIMPQVSAILSTHALKSPFQERKKNQILRRFNPKEDHQVPKWVRFHAPGNQDDLAQMMAGRDRKSVRLRRKNAIT